MTGTTNAIHESDRGLLVGGMESLGLPAGPETVRLLLEFVEELRKWARSYNLVAKGDLDALVGRHVLDSLAVHPHIERGTLLDAGSGAGFPGLPLAILDRGLEATLLDGSGKKVRFLRHARRTLGLENVHPVHSRLDAYTAGAPFDTIISRAFGPVLDFVSGVRHLAGPRTRILAMKGRLCAGELHELPRWIEVQAVEKTEVPDLHAERHLVIMALSTRTA